jgi:hypothetical protein
MRKPLDGIKSIAETNRVLMQRQRPSANSVYLYGNYIIILGAVFLLLPNAALQLMGMKTSSEVWIHIMGWFGIGVGIYYVVAGRSEAQAFFITTVYGRPTFLVFLRVLVVLKIIEPVILVIAGIDLATAIWTSLLLRSEKRLTN